MNIVRIYSLFENDIVLQNENNCSFGVSFLESPSNPFRQTCFCILDISHKGLHKVILGHDGGEMAVRMRKTFQFINKVKS